MNRVCNHHLVLKSCVTACLSLLFAVSTAQAMPTDHPSPKVRCPHVADVAINPDWEKLAVQMKEVTGSDDLSGRLRCFYKRYTSINQEFAKIFPGDKFDKYMWSAGLPRNHFIKEEACSRGVLFMLRPMVTIKEMTWVAEDKAQSITWKEPVVGADKNFVYDADSGNFQLKSKTATMLKGEMPALFEQLTESMKKFIAQGEAEQLEMEKLLAQEKKKHQKAKSN